jgi:DNA-binding response OmpR family regulator
MKHCFIIEDDPTTQVLLREIVRLQGFEASCFTSAEEAWQQLSQETPSLFLVDHNLPGMTGLELVRQIRAVEWFAHTPVVMVSGVIKTSEIWMVLNHGVDRFVPKPVDANELVGQIRSVAPQLIAGRDQHEAA